MLIRNNDNEYMEAQLLDICILFIIYQIKNLDIYKLFIRFQKSI
jgi:hypothetical protein